MKIKGTIFFILLVVIVIVIFLNRSKNDPPTSADYQARDELVDEAKREWLLSHDNLAAIQLYQEAIDRIEGDEEFDFSIYPEIAYQYYLAKSWRPSIEFYLKSFRSDSSSSKKSEHNLHLGACYAEMGFTDSAIIYLNESIKIGSKKWYAYSILSRVYEKKGDKNLSEKYFDSSNVYYKSEESSYSTSTSTATLQQEFENWLYRNTAVTEVHFESNWQIWVTLESYKYTSEENVEEIASTIARWYAQRMGQSFASCTVWRGDEIYAKGNSR